MPDSTLAKATIRRATAAMKDSQAVAFPEIIKLVHTLSQQNDEITVHDLADLVKKDSTVLVKTLQIANSLGYNPGQVRVTTVPQAIQMIGFNRVRTLAMSLLLLEQSSQARAADEQREATTLALCSGLFAQAAGAGQAAVDPEQAYVCAALRHFGRIVLTTFLTEEYRAARELAKSMPEEKAFRTLLGLTPSELGFELLRAEDLPAEVLAALAPCEPETLARNDSPADVRLHALAGFSAQLCELACRSDLSAAAFNEQSSRLAGRFIKLLPGIGAQMPDLLQAASQQLSRLKHGLGINTLPLSVLDRVKHRIAREDPPGTSNPPTSPTRTAPPAIPPAPAAARPAARPPAPSRTLATGLAVLTTLANQHDTTSETLCTTLLEIMQESFAAPECLLFLPRPGRLALHIAHGTGQAWRALQPQAAITPGERTLFGLCLQRRDNLLIHDARDPALATHTPAWLRAPKGLAAFALMPLFADDSVAGLLLVGWPERRKITLSTEQARQVREILALLARTLSK